ncbi:hypothetical protein LJR034_005420 [Caballeronia sp. LjRoot34]|uniref:hypothetical protein n=1 Tax=Caballeronia sp. LjRoot34 TaxID=3342325 RepID=UPI003ED12482
MEDVFDNELEFGLCQTGAIGTAKDFAPFARSAAMLRPTTPVLTANVDLGMVANCAGSGAGNFGLGCFQAEDCILLTMRLQVGTLQIYWLADASDPEVWKTIDSWKKGGKAGFALIQDKGAAFIPWDISGPQNGVEQFRGECGKQKANQFVRAATTLAGSGRVHHQATTDIPGVPLEHVLVSVLMTDRLTEVVKKNSIELLARVPTLSRKAHMKAH